jgi:alpha,alpha-trehalase
MSPKYAQTCRIVIAAVVAALFAAGPAFADGALLPPSAIYAELFERVQLERVFPDSKTFADAAPLGTPNSILRAYRQEREQPGFDLSAFVRRHFRLPEPVQVRSAIGESAGVEAYIDAVWPELVRAPAPAPSGSSLIALPKPYVVPGGRFTEIYYWDSYFTMRGLERSGHPDVVRAMLANFAWLVERFGHVPNGNRTYYLSRSQPPFLAFMVELVAEREGDAVYAEFLATLRREYAFWMSGAEELAPGQAHRRVVKLADGAVLNRYWDDRDTPRDEAYREDVETARASGRPPPEVYRHLRAAAESGWDFSSRWFADGRTLSSIRTTDLIPPDLNSLLYKLEVTIAKGCAAARDTSCAEAMTRKSDARKDAMHRYLWNRRRGVFTDYDWRAGASSDAITAATLYPLYVGASSSVQAQIVAKTVQLRLLESGGVGTTATRTGQQWDAPNGWAPLEWIAVQAFRNYGSTALAASIARRWVQTNLRLYRRTGHLIEKYDVERAAKAGGGGEYTTQIGFGWTNGVLKEFLSLYPELRTLAGAQPAKPAAAQAAANAP